MPSIDPANRQKLDEGLSCIEAALETLEADFLSGQVKLGFRELADSIEVATSDLGPKTLKDIVFAFDGLVALSSDLNEPVLDGCFDLLRPEIESLKAIAALRPDVVQRMLALRAKMVARRAANERQTFRPPGSPPEPLPHEPAELTKVAADLCAILAAAGFETPYLDRLAQRPDQFLVRDASNLIEEIDSVVD